MEVEAADAIFWKEYAIAREQCLELASASFKSQNAFDSLEKMYNLPDLDDAPIQAQAAAQKMRLQFLQRWLRNRQKSGSLDTRSQI